MPKKHYDWGQDGSIPEIGEHSLAKHRIIDEYVSRYIKILSANPRQPYLNLTIVDGFCGGGLYTYGTETVPGSPLILLRAVKAAEAELSILRRNDFKINADFFFIDENPYHCQFLRREIWKSEFKDELDKTIRIIPNQFEAVVPEINKFIKKKGTAHRSLFFLDQYGWSNISLKTISNIITELSYPEVLLTFAVDSLINYLNEGQAGSPGLLSLELNRSDVQELLTYKNQAGWRFLIQNDLYRHIQNYTAAKHYTPFFIKSPKSGRSYWLLHLSKHVRARDEMATLHWDKQNHFIHHGKSGFQALGFDPSQDIAEQYKLFDFNEINRDHSRDATLLQIPKIIRDDESWNSQGVTLEDIFSKLSNDSPVTKIIAGEAIVQLRQSKGIEITTKDGNPKPRANILSWDDRIILPRQRKLWSLPKDT